MLYVFFFIFLKVLFLFFFFFQAEDGIRDGTVTGVQTCAVPISLERACEGGHAAGRAEDLRGRHVPARRGDREECADGGGNGSRNRRGRLRSRRAGREGELP